MKIFKLNNQIMIASAAVLVLQACSNWSAMSPSEQLDLADMAVPVLVTPKVLADLHPLETELVVPTALTDYTPEPYTLGPGDKLFITVWDHPELTLPGGDSPDSGHNVRVIDDHGNLFFPFVGQIKAAGLTPPQLGRTLTARLERFIGEPQVGVSVAAYESRRAILQGAFERPGEARITNKPLSLRQAVETARVDYTEGDLSRLQLWREGELYTLDYVRLTREFEGADQIYLKHGDIIRVGHRRSREVSVLGEVKSPGLLLLSEAPTSAAKVLARGGGLAPGTADATAVFVVRQQGPEAQAFQLNAGNAAGIALMSQFLMQPDDVLYVGASRSTRFNRALTDVFFSVKEDDPTVTTELE